MACLSIRSSYTLKHCFLMLLLILDLSFNTAIDSDGNKITVVAMMGAQVIERILSLFLLFTLMWNTAVFKYGLMSHMCARFKLVFIVLPLSFVFMAAVRGLRGAAIFGGDTVPQIWDSNTYQALYVIHNLLSIVYYVAMLQAVFDLGNPNFYKVSTWLDR